VLESARFQWEEGSRRLAAETADPVRHRQLCDLVDAVVAELRRRIGQHFTLEELAGAHGVAEDWVREVVLESAPEKARVGVRDVTLVQDAAFHAYSRGAGNYRP
jgi:hypothetical protein